MDMEQRMIAGRRKGLTIVLSFVFGALAYSVLIANGLTNTYDGMWKGNRYTEYDWVVSLGRWFWPVVGGMRLHNSPEPFTSLVSLGLFTLGGGLVVSILKTWEKKSAALSILAILINTGVCVSLSYRYMSPTFAVAFFCSVAAAWVLSREWKILWFLAIPLIVMTLGAYQADLGCTCVLLLLVTVGMLRDGERWKAIGIFWAKSAGSVIVSCLIYKVIWDAVLKHYGWEASDYHGASSISIGGMIRHLPERLRDAYVAVYHYFRGDGGIWHHAFQQMGLYRLILLAVGACMVYVLVCIIRAGEDPLQKGLRCLTGMACLVLLPAAANVAMLIAVDGGGMTIQMTMPVVMLLPALLCMTGEEERSSEKGHLWQQILIWTPVVTLLFLLYGNFLQVSTDQHVMLTSRETALNLMNRVMADVEQRGFEQPAGGYVFLGNISYNERYRRDELWGYANAYARYGEFWLDGNCDTQSYYGTLRDAGFEIPFNWEHDYWHELEGREEIQAMSCYPAEGYVQEVDGCIVVKISN